MEKGKSDYAAREKTGDIEEIWLVCGECGFEQPDMGRGVVCENCGAYEWSKSEENA